MRKRLLLQLFLLIVSMGVFANIPSGGNEKNTSSWVEMTSTYFHNGGESWTIFINAGDIDSEVTYELSGNDPEYFQITKPNNWGQNGRYSHVNVVFTPDETRVYRCTITFRCGELDDASLDLTGVVTSASVNYANFGWVGVGTTSNVIKIKTLGAIFGTEQCYRFYSSDSEDTDVFTVIERDIDYYTLEGEITIVFNPEKVKEYKVNMEVSFMTRAKVNIQLVGHGVEGAPDDQPYITAYPKELSFPDRQRDKTTKQNIWVGKYNLIDEVSYELSGEGASAYTVDVVESGGYDIYEVSFTPEEVLIPYDAIVTFSSPDAELQTVILSGNAAPIIELSDEWLDFGELSYFHNETKELSVTVSGIDIVGDITYEMHNNNYGDVFTIDERDWDPSTGGTLYITFDPATEHRYSTAISFKSYGANDVYTILSGRGIVVEGTPILAVAGSYTGFMNPYPNTETEPQSITISGKNLVGDITYYIEESIYASCFKIDESLWNPATGGTLSFTYIPSKEDADNGSIPESRMYFVFESEGAVSKYSSISGSALSIMDNPEKIDFGKVQIGTTKTSQPIVISGINIFENDRFYNIYDYNSYDVSIVYIKPVAFDPETYSSTLEIAFTPKEERNYNVWFHVGSIVYSGSINLYGNGVSYDPVSIDTVDKDTQGLLIYPNPASEQITIKTGEENIGKTIGVYTINGVLLNSSIIKDITTQVDISSLTKGIYLVRVGEEYGKMVKQ